MPHLLNLNTYGTETGKLTVFEKVLNGDVKRVFYIYGVAEGETRASHGHHTATNALVCVAGSCTVYVKNGIDEYGFTLQHPEQCLVLNPGDWHTMSHFSANAVLLVLSDQYYDKADYIHEKP